MPISKENKWLIASNPPFLFHLVPLFGNFSVLDFFIYLILSYTCYIYYMIIFCDIFSYTSYLILSYIFLYIIYFFIKNYTSVFLGAIVVARWRCDGCAMRIEFMRSNSEGRNETNIVHIFMARTSSETGQNTISTFCINWLQTPKQTAVYWESFGVFCCFFFVSSLPCAVVVQESKEIVRSVRAWSLFSPHPHPTPPAFSFCYCWPNVF